jgi:hypothetical protein
MNEQIVELLQTCGFDETDVDIIMHGFLTGISTLMESMGTTSQTVGEFLTEDQVREVLLIAVEEHAAKLPASARSTVDVGVAALQEAFRGACL